MSSRLRRAFLAVPLLALALLSAIGAQVPAPPTLTVLAREGRRTIPVALVNDQEFVGVDDLATVFQLAVREDSLGALTVTYKDKTIVLTNQPLASVAGRLVSLPAAASRAGRRWLVPVEFINRALALIYDRPLELRKPSHLVIVGALRVPLVTVRYDPVATGGRLTIDTTPRANSTVTRENDRLTIRFEADALDVETQPLPAQGPQGLVQNVRVVDATALAAELGPGVAGFRATSLPIDTTMRLTIDVLATEPASAAPAVAGPAPPPLPPAFGTRVSPIQTIAIDPGHGGDDAGAVGVRGTREKDLTLAVARRIKAAIEGRLGIRVLLTRDDDRSLPLDDRTAVANNNKADLFISLHANASFRPSVTGAVIYYAAFEEAALAAAPTRVDRVPTFSGAMRDLELVAWDLAQMQHVDRSMTFAAILEERLRDRVPLGPRPIESAPLGVIESANMPAVLIEMGFLTNEAQEKELTAAAFQNAFVQAITESVIRFRDALQGGDR